MDIGTEELSHLEIVGTLARLHLKPMKFDRERAEADPLIAIAGGGGVNLCNSMGNPWTADYLKITGELDVDLRSNIAAEARAKIVYERLINFSDDAGTKDALQFLMTREITHMKAFTAALESMDKPRFSIGRIPPTPGLVDQFFNDSTGQGEDGEIDARGPWNEGDDWEFVEAPAFQDRGRRRQGRAHVDDRTRAARATRDDRGAAGRAAARSPHAEGQLVKALPKMVKAANGRGCSSVRGSSGRDQGAGRAAEGSVRLLGAPAKAKPCKGMAGLIEEGKEVMEEGKENDEVAADLALIAAAQKVEHYEISAYGTARAMAGQTGLPARRVAHKVAGRGRDRRQLADADRARTDVRVAHRDDQRAKHAQAVETLDE